jgi:hypothetical protein
MVATPLFRICSFCETFSTPANKLRMRVSVDGFERFLSLRSRCLAQNGVEQEITQDEPG